MENKKNTNNQSKRPRWDGKKITTAKQWQFNDSGTVAPQICDESKLWGAIEEYKRYTNNYEYY